jgi:anti-anti-sigma factor
LTAESHAIREDMTAVQLEGPIDFTTVPGIRKQLLGHARKRESREMCVDLSRVTLLDTAGVAMLVETWRCLVRRNGVLHLTGLSENARRLLQLARLDQVFGIEDAVE